MEDIHRKILFCVVALLVLSLFGTGTAAAEEVDKGNMKVPITVACRGYGFALAEDGGEFHIHILRMHIVRVMEIDPRVVREIMRANKSIEEIRSEITEKGGAHFYRGHIRFVERHYRLRNISMGHGGNNLTLALTINADIMLPLHLQGSEPLQSKSTGSVGNISVTVRNHEGVRIGEGRLRMYGEEYRVLLNIFL